MRSGFLIRHFQVSRDLGEVCFFKLCVLLPLENLLWAKLRDYAISRVNPNPRQAFLM